MGRAARRRFEVFYTFDAFARRVHAVLSEVHTRTRDRPEAQVGER